MHDQSTLENMLAMRRRPLVMGTHGAITSGHYLATAAGHRIAQQGGNAIDIAAAVGLCLSVLEPQECTPGGEVPMLVYSARERKTRAISGVGWSPKALTIDWCQEQKIDLIPGDGYIPACVPAVVGTWALALQRFGTMSFAQVVEPAIQLADEGFPMYAALQGTISGCRDRFLKLYPTSAEVYLTGREAPQVGARFRNPDLAEVFRTLCRAEADQAHRGRLAGVEAARDAFYKGPIAERIAGFIRDNPVEDDTGCVRPGLLTFEDFAEWRAAVEEPVSLRYRGLDVHKCSSWTQGPVFLQQLSLLAGMDLRAMGLNSPEYIHARIECAKLAFADREAYYGDPLFDDVPFDLLLSEGYAAQRRALVGETASPGLRPGSLAEPPPADPFTHPGDTTHLDVIDAEGNMVSATPSGGWISASPVISGLGFPLGTRAQMFFLEPGRPNALAGHKRPRATLTPTLVTKNGDPLMVFGARGGDTQDQTTIQFFLAHMEFGLDLQQALDVPTFWIEDFPCSFYPRQANPGSVVVENTLDPAVIAALRARGHTVTSVPVGLKMMAIRRSAETGIVAAGVCSTAEQGYAIGW